MAACGPMLARTPATATWCRRPARPNCSRWRARSSRPLNARYAGARRRRSAEAASGGRRFHQDHRRTVPTCSSPSRRSASGSNIRFLGHLSPTVDVRAAAPAGHALDRAHGPARQRAAGLFDRGGRAAARAAAADAARARRPRGPSRTSSRVRSRIRSSTHRRRNSRAINASSQTYSEAQARDLAAHFVAAGTWLVPTLIRVRTMEIGDDPQYRNDPNLQYVPAADAADVGRGLATIFGQRIAGRGRARRSNNSTRRRAKLVKPFKDGRRADDGRLRFGRRLRRRPASGCTRSSICSRPPGSRRSTCCR